MYLYVKYLMYESFFGKFSLSRSLIRSFTIGVATRQTKLRSYLQPDENKLPLASFMRN